MIFLFQKSPNDPAFKMREFLFMIKVKPVHLNEK